MKALYASGAGFRLVSCRSVLEFHFGPPVKCHKIFETVPGCPFSFGIIERSQQCEQDQAEADEGSLTPLDSSTVHFK